MVMLSFELCKKLKTAGFPQETQWIVYYLSSPSTSVNNRDYYALCDVDLGLLPVQDSVACPTLSELIEACGDGFENLYQYRATSKWACSVVESCLGCNPEGWDEQGTVGDTPEEAVANLYLALHNS